MIVNKLTLPFSFLYFFVYILIASFFSIPPVNSQEKKINTSPLRLSAEKALLNKESGVLQFLGKVKIFYRDFEITADTIKAFQENKSTDEKISLIEAEGNVFISNNKDINAKGDTATFDVEQKFIVLKGNVELKQGQSVIRGNSVSLDLLSENIEFDGGVSSYVFN